MTAMSYEIEPFDDRRVKLEFLPADPGTWMMRDVPLRMYCTFSAVDLHAGEFVGIGDSYDECLACADFNVFAGEGCRISAFRG